LPPPGFVTVGVAAPTLFVFVGTSHFSEPVHRSRVIVNNTKIINQTTVINNIRRENRTVSGGTAQQVVINQGPGIDPIQKATGKTVSAVPIGDAVRRTPVPTTLKPQPFSPTGQQTPTVNRPAIPDRNQVPAKTIQPPPANGSSRPQMVPPSDPRTRPPTPPANGQAPGRGHDQKPDQERGRGHDKDGG
jgi:hypothetical protein